MRRNRNSDGAARQRRIRSGDGVGVVRDETLGGAGGEVGKRDLDALRGAPGVDEDDDDGPVGVLERRDARAGDAARGADSVGAGPHEPRPHGHGPEPARGRDRRAVARDEVGRRLELVDLHSLPVDVRRQVGAGDARVDLVRPRHALAKPTPAIPRSAPARLEVRRLRLPRLQLRAEGRVGVARVHVTGDVSQVLLHALGDEPLCDGLLTVPAHCTMVFISMIDI